MYSGMSRIHFILLMVQKSGEPVEVGSLSNYLQVFHIPGGAGFLPSTVL